MIGQPGRVRVAAILPAARPAVATERRLSPLYRAGFQCPACWGASFYVGRITAECGRCGCAYDLAASNDSVGQR